MKTYGALTDFCKNLPATVRENGADSFQQSKLLYSHSMNTTKAMLVNSSA